MAITRFNAKNGLSVGTGSLGVVDSTGNIEAQSLGVTGSITPAASGIYDIGSPTRIWRNIYVTNISGSLTGSGIEANSIVFARSGGVLTGSLDQFSYNPSTGNVAIGTNVAMYKLDVGGSIKGRDGLYTNATVFASDASITNTVTANALSGSLTRLSNGSSYLIAGTNVSITSASNGSVTIATSGLVEGSGTTNYVPKFTATSTLGNSNIFDNGTNVGIGTANPTYELQVGSLATAGTRGIAIVDSGYGIRLQGGGTVARIQSLGTSYPLELQAGNLNDGNYRFSSTGNVGIGSTTTISAKLQISGSATASTPTMVIREGVVSPTGGAEILDVQNSAGTSIFVVSGSGNVGIGNGNLLYAINSGMKLDIRGNLAITNGGGIFIGDGTSFYRRLIAQDTSPTNVLRVGADTVQFTTLTLTSQNSPDLFALSQGNVGIGSTAPTSRFFVSGSSTAATPTATIKSGHGTQTSAVLDVQDNGGTSLFWVSGSSIGEGIAYIKNNIYMGSGASASTRFYLGADNSGNPYHNASSTHYFQVASVYKAVLNTNGLAINNSSTGAGSGVGLIVASGNVGIGTTNPRNALTVGSVGTVGSTLDSIAKAFIAQESSTYGIAIYKSGASAGQSAGNLVFGAQQAGGVAVPYAQLNGVAEDVTAGAARGNLTFSVANAGVLTPAVTIQYDKTTVFSGSANPDIDLQRDLGSATKRWNNLYVANISGSLTGSGLEANSVVFAGTGGVLTGSNSRLNYNPSTGNFGINYNAPMYKLDVGGDVNARGFLYGQNASITNTLTANALSGSLTKLSDGTSYLVAGANISITSASNGSVTVATSGLLGGSGTTNYVAKFTGTSTLGNSQIYDDGTNVGIGALPTTYKLEVRGGAFISGSQGLTITTSEDPATYSTNNGGQTLFSMRTVSNATNYLAGQSFGSIFGYTRSSNNYKYSYQIAVDPNGVLRYRSALDANNWNPWAFTIEGGTGNVGVGVTTLYAKFGVWGDIGAWSTGVTSLGSPVGASLYLGDINYYNAGYYNQAPGLSALYDATPGVAGSLGFYSYNGSRAERMRITATGRVGIGGTNPLARFEVTGSGATSSTSTMHLVNSSNSSLLFVRDDGNVGVGTSSPGYKFDVNGNSQLYGNLLVGNTVAGGSTVRITTHQDRGLTIKSNISSTVKVTAINPLSSDTLRELTLEGSPVTIYTGASAGTSGTESMRINATGNVGIGTATYDARLYVSGSSTTSDAVILGRAGVPAPSVPLLNLQNSAGTSAFYVDYLGNIVAGTSAAGMVLDFRANNANRLDLRFTDGATWYINPDRSSASYVSFFENTFGGQIRVATRNADVSNTIRNGSSFVLDARYWNGSANAVSETSIQALMDSTGPDYRMRLLAGSGQINIRSNGNVGIGVTNPGYTLDVNGAIAIRGNENADIPRLHFQASDQSNRFTVETDLDPSAGNDLLGFRSFTVDNILILKGNGNVGIGETNPVLKLDFGTNNTGFFLKANPGAATSVVYTGHLHNDMLVGSYIDGGSYPNHVISFGHIADSARKFHIGSASDANFNASTTFVPTMTFTAGNNVGIGSANPGTRLDVAGAARSTYGVFSGSLVSYASSTGALYAYYVNSTSVLLSAADNSATAAPLDFFTGASRAMRIDTSQNIGIGTVTYTARLFVSGTSTASTPTMIVRGGVASPTGGALLFDVQNSAGTSVLLVSGSGNVGVNALPTTFPLAVFRGATTTPQISAMGTSGVSGVAGYNMRIDTTDLWQLITDNNALNGFYVQYNNSTSARYLTVATGGNVGIGSSSPASRLDVLTTTGTGQTVTQTGTTNSQVLALAFTGGAVGSTSASSALLRVTTNSGFRPIASFNDVSVVDAAGNFAVGAISTTARLTVSGSTTASSPVIIAQAGLASPSARVLDIKNVAGTTVASVDHLGNIYGVSGSYTGDVTISGNLTVAGTQTIVNSDVVNIKDNAILLNAGPSPLSTGGIYVGDTTTNITGSLIWDAVTDQWKAGRLGSETTLVSGSGTTNYLAKWSGTNGLGNSIVYDDGTNVGIGTASPSDKFQVGSTAAGNFRISNVGVAGHYYQAESVPRLGIGRDLPYDATATASGYVSFTNGGGTLAATGGAVAIIANRALSFFTSNATALTPRMTIDGSGNVGIGTTVPAGALDFRRLDIQHNGYTTAVVDLLTTGITTGSFRYEVARVGIDYNDWNQTGSIEIELLERYWAQGSKKKYVVWYGYTSYSGSYLTEVSGPANAQNMNNYQLTIGSEVIVTGDQRYIPIYVDVQYYTNVTAVIRTNRVITTTNPPIVGTMWVNKSPSGVSLTPAFTPSTYVYLNNIGGYNSVFNYGYVGIGSSTPTLALDILHGVPQIRVKGTSTTSETRLIANWAGGALGAVGTADNSPFMIYTNSAERMRFDSSGNVGINTTSMTLRLEVSGSDARIHDVRVGRGAGSIVSNTVVGNSAFVNNSTGVNNTAVGYLSLNAATNNNNTAIGVSAGEKISGGAANVFVGMAAGGFAVSAGNVTYVGQNSGLYQLGSENTGIGRQSLFGVSNQSTATQNTAIGTYAGYSVTTGGNNFFGGFQAGYSNSTAVGGVVLGYQAGYYNASGSYNISIGYQAGFGVSTASTTGIENVTIGYIAGYRMTSANRNVVVGSAAGNSLSTGGNNVMIGYAAGYRVTTSTEVTAVGNLAIAYNTGASNTSVGSAALRGLDGQSTGGGNTAIGTNTGVVITTGTYNSIVGYNAGLYLSTGTSNSFMGFRAGQNTSVGGYNVAVGIDAGVTNASGSFNVSVGYQAGYSSLTTSYLTSIGSNANLYQVGTGLVAVGAEALKGVSGQSTATNNTALGYQAGFSITTGGSNFFGGYQAGYSTTSGANNTALGLDALYSNVTSNNNTAVGLSALRSNTSSGNTALGYSAAWNTNAANNTALGRESLNQNVSGQNNTAVGTTASYFQLGSFNVSLGFGALFGAGSGASTAGNNTALGYEAGAAITTGGNNVFVGYRAGNSATTGTNNIVIGSGAALSAVANSNSIVIGSGSTGLGSGTTVIGNSSTVFTYLAGDVGIGTTSSNSRLFVSGSSNVGFSMTVLREGLAAQLGGAGILDVQRSNGTSVLFVSGSGNVGIGVSTPSYPLQVKTQAANVNTISLINDSGNVSRLGWVQDGSTSLAYSSIDGDGRTTGYLRFNTNNAERVRIDSSGNVGVGTSSVTNHGAGSTNFAVNATSNALIDWMVNGTRTASAYAQGSITNFGTVTATPLAFITQNTERARIDGSGNVGIGTTIMADRLAVNGSMSVTGSLLPGVDGSYNLGTSTKRWAEIRGVNVYGQIFPTSGTPGSVLYISSTGMVAQDNSNLFWNDSTKRLGIGTSSPGFRLEVNGDFVATTKSFVIPHPTKQGWKLRYGSLESPYHGIRLTGEGEVVDGICEVELPEYIATLCKQSGAQVQITNLGHDRTLWVDSVDVTNSRFTIKTKSSFFAKFFTKKTYKFFWSFSAVRKDIEDMVVEFNPCGN